jgi:hypothetical protein
VPVRKTESRLPANFQAADFGEALVAPDGRCVLISFITSPLAADRENVYVVFVTDKALAEAANSFEWRFTENRTEPTIQTTQHGEISYVPQVPGNLELSIRILGEDNSEQAILALAQDVVPLNPILENLISEASNEPGPGIANPDVARELVNNYSSYYQGVTLQTPEAGDVFQEFVFSMVLAGALQRTTAQRNQHVDKLAQSVNSQGTDFATLAAQGVGVCGIRLSLLAMTFQQAPGNPTPLIDWTELPELPSQRALADEQLREKLAALDEAARIDLFNLARFPKSNITRCAHVLEALRDRYFNGTNFNDVVTGMSGTRAERIIRHYQEGPLLRS